MRSADRQAVSHRLKLIPLLPGEGWAGRGGAVGLPPPAFLWLALAALALQRVAGLTVAVGGDQHVAGLTLAVGGDQRVAGLIVVGGY